MLMYFEPMSFALINTFQAISGPTPWSTTIKYTGLYMPGGAGSGIVLFSWVSTAGSSEG